MSDQSWPATNLGELFTINTDGVAPNASPGTEFHHHSLPAWDEFGGPAVEKGSSIESNKTKVTKPCVLVSKLNPRKPRVSVVERVPEEEHHCASTEFVCLEPKSEEPLNFWGHLFSNKSFSDKLDRIAIGSTNSHKRYSPKALLSQRIELPPVTERRLIAHILDTLDTQIQKTEALIAKLEKVKEGLLHDLLTRGIDENGLLRPSPKQAPELYKESPLGLIPREWEIATLESVSNTVTSGSRDWARFYADSGALFVRIGNLTREHINFRYESSIYVRPPQNADGQRTKLEAGDVLISITADLGIIGVIPEGMGDAYINQHIALVRPNFAVINPRFVGHYLASQVAQTYISKLNDAGAKAGLNLPTIRHLLTVRPHRDEQDSIAMQLDEIDSRVQRAITESKELRKLKSGLMDDLLTGRVRVTPLLDQAQAQATTPA